MTKYCSVTLLLITPFLFSSTSSSERKGAVIVTPHSSILTRSVEHELTYAHAMLSNPRLPRSLAKIIYTMAGEPEWRKGKKLTEIFLHHAYSKLSSDGKSIVTTNLDAPMLFVIDIATNRCIRQIPINRKLQETWACSDKGLTVAICRTTTIDLYQADGDNNYILLDSIPAPEKDYGSLVMSADGTTLAYGVNGVLHIWDISTRRLVHSIPGNFGSIIISGNGERIAAVNLADVVHNHILLNTNISKPVKIFDKTTGKLLHVFPIKRGESIDAISGDGNVIAIRTSERKGLVTIWRCGEATPFEIPYNNDLYKVMFSTAQLSYGGSLVMVASEGAVKIYDIKNRTLKKIIKISKQTSLKYPFSVLLASQSKDIIVPNRQDSSATIWSCGVIPGEYECLIQHAQDAYAICQGTIEDETGEKRMPLPLKIRNQIGTYLSPVVRTACMRTYKFDPANQL